jgi:hypothetical protein
MRKLLCVLFGGIIVVAGFLLIVVFVKDPIDAAACGTLCGILGTAITSIGISD